HARSALAVAVTASREPGRSGKRDDSRSEETSEASCRSPHHEPILPLFATGPPIDARPRPAAPGRPRRSKKDRTIPSASTFAQAITKTPHSFDRISRLAQLLSQPADMGIN